MLDFSWLAASYNQMKPLEPFSLFSEPTRWRSWFKEKGSRNGNSVHFQPFVEQRAPSHGKIKKMVHEASFGHHHWQPLPGNQLLQDRFQKEANTWLVLLSGFCIDLTRDIVCYYDSFFFKGRMYKCQLTYSKLDHRCCSLCGNVASVRSLIR